MQFTDDLDGQTVAEFFTKFHNKLRLRRCTRCYLRGHDRASCWYLQAMNQEVRRSGSFTEKRRYAVIRAWFARKGTNAIKYQRSQLKKKAEEKLGFVSVAANANADFLCAVGKAKYKSKAEPHAPVAGFIQ